MSSGIEYRSVTLETLRPSVVLSPGFIVRLGGSNRSCAAGAALPACNFVAATPGAAAPCAGFDADGTAFVGAVSGEESSRYTRTFESVPAAIVRKLAAVIDGIRIICGVNTISTSWS